MSPALDSGPPTPLLAQLPLAVGCGRSTVGMQHACSAHTLFSVGSVVHAQCVWAHEIMIVDALFIEDLFVW